MTEDQDVICLSSDDETKENLPKKKRKLSHNSMLRPKTEQNADKDVIVCKRKIPETRLSDLFPTKKPRIVSDGDIEEIIIESPCKTPSGESERKSDLSKCLENKGEINSVKATTSRIGDDRAKHEISHSRVSVHQDVSNRSSSLEQKNSKTVTTNDNDCKILSAQLPTKTQKEQNGSESSLAKIVYDFFDAKEKSANKAKSIAKVSSLSKKSAEPSLEIVSSKIDNSKIKSTNNIEAQKNSNIALGSSKIDVRNVEQNGDARKRSISPEVQILPCVKTPKSTNKNIDNINVEKNSTKSANMEPRRISESLIETPKCFPNAAIDLETQRNHNISKIVENVLKVLPERKVCPPMPRCLKINTAKSLNETILKSPIIKLASRSPKIRNCEILSGSDKVSVPIDEIVKQPLSGKTSGNISEKSSNLTSPNIDIEPVNSEVSSPVNRLIPRSVPRSPNILNEPKSINTETPVANGKNGGSSTSPNDTRTEYFTTSEVPENTKLANGDSSKPRELEKKDNSPNSPKNVTEATKESSNSFEPKPGCSKSPDPCGSPEKPQLVVKSIKPAYTINHDTFSMFLGLLQQTDRGGSMPKIISKLKRYYDEMDQSYARSREFEQLLNEKREKICMKGKGRVYVYTAHVMDEMKRRRKRKDKKVQNIEVPENPAVNEQNGEFEEEEDDSDEARRRRSTIKKIDKAMTIVEKKIKKLEEREVDWEDDNNSSYMKLDRYKAKMIELWNKRCELTNEHADAGRPYLRPKHVRLTLIPSVDQAINSFINSKLGSNRKKKKGASLLDGVIFPDHVDILECIAKVNETQNLGLDKRRQEKLAKQAFIQLGEHLQKVRQNDYWDTFSLDLDKGDDPAAKDSELEEKLEKNQKISKERTSQVLEEFANKQEEARMGNQAENDDDEDEEDEEEEEEEQEEQVDSNDENTDLEFLEDGNENHESEGELDSVRGEEEGNPKETESRNDDVSTQSNEKNSNDSPTIETVPESSDNTNIGEANENEVHLLEDSKEETSEPDGETRKLLRIRSFAKPPETWQASQEKPFAVGDRESKTKAADTTEKSSGKSSKIETIDITENDNIQPVSSGSEKKEKELKTLNIDNRTVVVKPFDKNLIKAIPNSDAPKVILVSKPSAGSMKNRSSIIVQAPINQPSNRVNVNNLNNIAQTQKNISVSPLTQQLRISQPGNSKLQPIALNRPPQQLGNPSLQLIAQKSSQPMNSPPQQLGTIVKRLANGQFVRCVKQNPANGVLNPRIPQGIQMRPVSPQQQTRPSIVKNLQIPTSQFVRLKNPQYYPASANPRSSELSQINNSSKPILPFNNGQGIRIAEPGNARVVSAIPSRRTPHMQVVEMRDGQLIAKPVIKQNLNQGTDVSNRSDGKISDACKATVAGSAYNATKQSPHAVLTLRNKR